MKMKKINKEIMQKCSFVSLQSIDESGFYFELNVDDIVFGPWGIKKMANNDEITDEMMPIDELQEMGMNENQKMQLMREINYAMDYLRG